MYSIVLLSLIQSLTEFLPISSSGHLLILGKLGVSQQSLGLDVLLHLGTLLAVVCYFFQDILALLKSFKKGHDKSMLIRLIVATLPILVVGGVAFHLFRNVFRTMTLIALNSIFWGVILWIVDKYAPKKKKLNSLTIKGAFLIGCGQAVALIPGTSRSGITMSVGRLLGINRVDTAKFSMLLSIPTICAAVAYTLFQGLKGNLELPVLSISLWGIFLSAFFGFCVISFLMKWLKHSSFGIFALYRILLGLFVLIYIII